MNPKPSNSCCSPLSKQTSPSPYINCSPGKEVFEPLATPQASLETYTAGPRGPSLLKQPCPKPCPQLFAHTPHPSEEDDSAVDSHKFKSTAACCCTCRKMPCIVSHRPCCSPRRAQVQLVVQLLQKKSLVLGPWGTRGEKFSTAFLEASNHIPDASRNFFHKILLDIKPNLISWVKALFWQWLFYEHFIFYILILRFISWFI